jgi:hypothetical protein
VANIDIALHVDFLKKTFIHICEGDNDIANNILGDKL